MDLTHDPIDRLDIERVVYRLGRCLDERDFDGLRDLFTPDASIATPGGAVIGHDALVAQARRGHSDDEGIQHIVSNVLIELADDRAEVRANFLAVFAHAGPADPSPFLLGEVYRLTAQRTEAGWRIDGLSTAPVWTLKPPPLIARRLGIRTDV